MYIRTYVGTLSIVCVGDVLIILHGGMLSFSAACILS